MVGMVRACYRRFWAGACCAYKSICEHDQIIKDSIGHQFGLSLNALGGQNMLVIEDYWTYVSPAHFGKIYFGKIHFQISPQRRKFCLWRSSLLSSSTVASLQTSVLNDVISVHLRAVPIVITWCHKCMSVHWMYTSYSTPFDVGPCMQNLQTKIFVRFVLINKCKKVGIWNFNKIFQVYFTTCVCIAFLTNPCPIQEFYLNFLHGTCMFSTKMYIFVSLKCLHITNLSPHTCDKYEVWSLWDQHFMSLIVFFWNNA